MRLLASIITLAWVGALQTSVAGTLGGGVHITSVDFGTTDIGGHKTQSLSVTNDQTATLTDLSFTLDGRDAEDFALDVPAITELAPGATAKFSVTFVPGLEHKVSEASVNVGHFRFLLSATAGTRLLPVRVEEVGGSVITALSAPVDFGSPMVGKSTSKTFRITNMGTAPILNLQASVDEPSGSLFYWGEPSYPPGVEHALIYTWLPRTGPTFSGFGVNSSSPAILSPGEGTTISIRWSPWETQAKTRTVRFAGLNSAPANVVVTGAATPYVFTTPRLAALHYRFGDSPDWLEAPASYVGPMMSSSSLNYPDESGLTPSTAQRWTDWVPNSGSYFIRQPDSRWQASQLLYLEPTRSSGINYPGVSGPNSAWGMMGSRLGLEIADRNYLRSVGAMLKLPATDRVGMELWMKPTWANDKPVSGEQCVSFVGQTADAGFGLWLVDGAVQGRAGAARVTLPSALSAEWHHVALLLNGGRLSLRIDGVESAAADGASLPASVKSFTVGMTYYGTNPAQVTLDELRLFELADDFDPNTDLLFTAKPTAQVDKTTLDFGNVPLKTAPTQDFRLTNTGPGWLRILSVRLTGEAAAEFGYQSAESQLLQPDRPADPTYSPGLLSIAAGTLTLSRGAIQSSGIRWLGDNTMRAAVAPGASMRINVLHLPSALGNRQATLTLTTDDLVHPTIEIELHANATPSLPAQLDLSPKEWLWGTLNTNESRTMTFYPSNSGGEPLTQLQAEIVGPHAGDYTLETLFFNSSTILSPRQYHFGVPGPSPITAGALILPPEITVTVQPRAAGPRFAWLRVHSNDPARPIVDIPMFGRCVEPQPHLTLRNHPLSGTTTGIIPTLASGSTLELESQFDALGHHYEDIGINNTGTKTLTISSSRFIGPNASEFSWASGLSPTTIEPNGNNLFNIDFYPLGSGTRQATLVIESNDPDQPLYQLHLTSTAPPPKASLRVVNGDSTSDLSSQFLRLGTAVVKGFRNADYTLPTQHLTIKNEGTATMANARLSFIGANAEEFTATITNTLATGASGEIVITFDPKAIGPRAATLRIESDAGLLSEVAVGGTGAYGEKASFSPQLPVGWVTTAMAEYQHQSLLIAGYAGERPARKYELYVVDRSGWLYSDHLTANGAIRSIAAQGQKVWLAGEFTLILHIPNPPHFTGSGGAAEQRSPQLPLYYDAACQGLALWNAPPAPNVEAGETGLLGRPYRQVVNLPVTGDFVGRAAVALPGGKILVGGSGSLGGRKNLIRLNADGSLDTTFTLPEPDGPVNALALQDDGKVLVGGEYTNLGQAYVPGPMAQEGAANFVGGTVIRAGTSRSGNIGGLCRLNSDGTLDITFGNPGFIKVTTLAVLGDRIAVGGEDQWVTQSRWNFWDSQVIGFSSNVTQGDLAAPIIPSDSSYSLEPKVRLLSLAGQTLASYAPNFTPRVVALHPGSRMYFAPMNQEDVTSYLPDITLIQPVSSQGERWGLRSEGDGSPAVTYQVQRFQGEVRAMLPLADGRMFVGGVSQSSIVSVTATSGNGLGTPNEEVKSVNGFVQLDIDGFVSRTVSTLTQSDGLAKLDVPATLRADPPASTSLLIITASLGYDDTPGVRLPLPTQGFGWPFAGLYFIDGPDADEFEVGPWVDPPGLAYIRAPDPSIIVRCRTHRSGVHRAVLHIAQNGIANPFDIALEAVAESSLPGGMLVTETLGKGTMTNGGNYRFGDTIIGESKPHTFGLQNQGAAPVTTPLTMKITGADAADFTITQAAVYPIAVGAGSGFTVTFTPKGGDAAKRSAVLSISNGGFAFELNLTGTATESPPAHFVSLPSDTVVFKGQSITLTAYPQGAQPMSLQWLREGKAIMGATGNTLTIPMAKLMDAGAYALRATNARGSATSRAALVGVVDMQPQTITSVAGRTVVTECKAAGMGMTYQWFKDGEPLSVPGASSAKLTLNRVEAGQAGAYTCQLKLGTAMLMSPAITLNMIGVPVVTSGFANVSWMVTQAVREQLTVESAVPVRLVAQGLPPGVKLNPTTGEVTGKPTKLGTYRVRVSVTNAAGRGQVFEQVVTVRSWPAGFVGAHHGYVSLESGGYPIGDWTLVGLPNGTFTAKIRTASSDIVAGTDKASGERLLGGMKVESLMGAFEVVPESESIFHADATLELPDSGVFHVTITVSDGSAQAQFTRISGESKIITGGASPTLRAVSSRYVGSYTGALAQYQGGSMVDSPGASYSARFNGGSSMSWVLKLGSKYGPFVASGSCPIMEGPSSFATCALPTPEGGHAVGMWSGFETSAENVLSLAGVVAWPGGTIENQTRPEDGESMSFSIRKSR